MAVPSEVRDMPLMVRGDGEEVTCDVDNTVVYLFKGDDELDHVGVKLASGKLMVVYEADFIQACLNEKMPVLMRFDRPEWAINRRVSREMRRLDGETEQLLGGDS